MSDPIRHYAAYIPFFFPVFFIAFWLTITTILGYLSGWFSLMRHYPNREETELIKLRYQSGMMGAGVTLNHALTLSACPSGLRVGMMKIFGIFWSDFFVPWRDIQVQRKDRYFWKVAELQLGNPQVGCLCIPAHVANRLAQSAKEYWPEKGPLEEETTRDIVTSAFRKWVANTLLVALFLFAVTEFFIPQGVHFPSAIFISFAAIMFGLESAVGCWLRLRP